MSAAIAGTGRERAHEHRGCHRHVVAEGGGVLTLNPKPRSINPQPQTPNPKPQTPNPKSYTLKAKP